MLRHLQLHLGHELPVDGVSGVRPFLRRGHLLLLAQPVEVAADGAPVLGERGSGRGGGPIRGDTAVCGLGHGLGDLVVILGGGVIFGRLPSLCRVVLTSPLSHLRLRELRRRGAEPGEGHALHGLAELHGGRGGYGVYLGVEFGVGRSSPDGNNFLGIAERCTQVVQALVEVRVHDGEGILRVDIRRRGPARVAHRCRHVGS
mmetsp:Transcript_18792/g.30162  ORF Transcript_18792/g.30162 Transcript_18792/m.30162 type:complete len:202 (-) Transcript_18792:1542-2147(-)